MEVGVKESFKNLVRRLKWTSHVERVGDEKWAESRGPESEGEKEARKIENVMGGLHYERSGKTGRGMENNNKR